MDLRKLSAFYRWLLLLSGVLAIAGEKLSVPVLTRLGLICAGLLMASVGVELIVTRRADFAIGGWTYTQARESYRGRAAQLWGVIFLSLGLLAILSTLASWFFPATTHAVTAALQGTPTGTGLALTGLGLGTILYGSIRLLAGSAGVDLGRLTRLGNLLDRLGGAVFCLIGAVLALFGVLLILDPDTVHATGRQLKTMLLHWL
jgi:hypothetical protein